VGLVLVLAGLGGAIAFGAYQIVTHRTPVLASPQQLEVGDCVKDKVYADVLPRVVRKIPCGTRHFGEVFAILELPDLQDYPGDEQLQRFGRNCGRELPEYAPDLSEATISGVAVGYPQPAAWADGERSVVCVAMSKGERWASLRG
jgi:hypothetical protein